MAYAATNDLGDTFRPVVIRKAGGFCVYLEEWNISGVGETIEQAYQHYEQNKKTFEEHSEEFSLGLVSREAYPKSKYAALRRDLWLFTMKAALGSFAVILVVVILLPNISNAISHQIRTVTETVYETVLRPEFLTGIFWATEFPAKLNAQLDRLDAEETAKMKTEWNNFFTRADPMIGPLLCGQRKSQ